LQPRAGNVILERLTVNSVTKQRRWVSRGKLLLAVLVGASVVAATASAAGPRVPGHPLLVDQPGLRVYGPARHVDTPCPHLLALPERALSIVKRAVELAMPPFEKRLRLDGRNPIVSVRPASRSGFSPSAGGCGRAAWGRSIVAGVLLPRVERLSAGMSQHTFAVGRVRQGWVLWGYIH
jgi:hypothetical protein